MPALGDLFFHHRNLGWLHVICWVVFFQDVPTASLKRLFPLLHLALASSGVFCLVFGFHHRSPGWHLTGDEHTHVQRHPRGDMRMRNSGECCTTAARISL